MLAHELALRVAELQRIVDVDLAAYRAATASVISDRVKSGEFPQALVDKINAIK